MIKRHKGLAAIPVGSWVLADSYVTHMVAGPFYVRRETSASVFVSRLHDPERRLSKNRVLIVSDSEHEAEQAHKRINDLAQQQARESVELRDRHHREYVAALGEYE